MMERRQAIERANKILYEDSDRMKSFQSKQMMCDVLAEREAQVQLKDELMKLEQIRDERYLEMEKMNYRNMLERELREKESLGGKAKHAAETQKANQYLRQIRQEDELRQQREEEKIKEYANR